MKEDYLKKKVALFYPTVKLEDSIKEVKTMRKVLGLPDNIVKKNIVQGNDEDVRMPM